MFWDKFVEYLPKFADGLWLTIWLTLISAVIGFFMSIPLVVGVLYGNRFFKLLCKGYITIVRGTPLLVQLFFIYYGLPGLLQSEVIVRFNTWLLQAGIPALPSSVNPFTAAVIAFILNSAAYQAEYFKGGFLAITTEQMEASYSIGLTKWQAIRLIIFPQAFRFSIPALSNEVVYLIKYTSVAYIITVEELFAKATFFASNTFYFLEIYLIIGALYLLLILIVTKLTEWLERKLYIPGFEISHLR